VDLGISECTAILAEIALQDGSLTQAKALADESLAAAIRAGSSPWQMATAHYLRAAVAFEASRYDEKSRPDARALTEEALMYSSERGIVHLSARSKLLLSKFYAPDDIGHRGPLVADAMDLLNRSQNERRGSAEAEYGAVLLDNDIQELARFYLEHGLQVSEELLRKVDVAYVRGELAQVEALEGNTRQSLVELERAARAAQQNGQLLLALEREEKLSQELLRKGFLVLSKDWAQQAVRTIETLLLRDTVQGQKDRLMRRKILLNERIVEIRLKLSPSTGPEV
jgi:hypothetical protein